MNSGIDVAMAFTAFYRAAPNLEEEQPVNVGIMVGAMQKKSDWTFDTFTRPLFSSFREKCDRHHFHHTSVELHWCGP